MAWYGRDYGERGWGGGYDPRDTGWTGGSYYGGDRAWPGRGYQDEGLGGRHAGRRPHHERMSFEPRDEYDRDMGDQFREGWQGLKRGVRRAFGGGGYDRGYGGRGEGEGRFYGGRPRSDRWGSRDVEGESGWPDRGFGERGWGNRELGERGWGAGEGRYGGRWQGSSRGYRTGRGLERDENRYW